MTMWNPVIDRQAGPLYLAIADAIARDIDEGRLHAGDRLPTQRSLARMLGVALTTVTRAYAEAERRRLVSGEVGRGTFIRHLNGGGAAQSVPDVIDFRTNVLSPLRYGRQLADDLSRMILEADPEALLDYHDPTGRPDARNAGAEWARRLGIEADADRVLVTCGAQHAMTVAFATLARAGDTVLTEWLTYRGMKSLASLLGLRLRGVPIDEHGVIPEAFREACRSTGARVAFCMPTIQNPTTAVMPDARRREIAQIAGEYGVTLVEDDSYGFLVQGARPIAADAPEVVYLTGTSKSLAPGLRVGFMVAPAGLVDRLAAAIGSTTYFAPPAMASAVAKWTADGTVDRVNAWKREEARARQTIARELLGGLGYHAHPAAHHGWITLPEPWCTGDFVSQARIRGVVLSPAEDFTVERSDIPHAVRVSLGPPSTREELTAGLETLRDALAAPPVPCSTVA